MTDPIQDAIDRTLASHVAPETEWKPIEMLEEARELLRQAKFEINNLRLSVDGERRVKEQYYNELMALIPFESSAQEKVRALKEELKLVRSDRALGILASFSVGLACGAAALALLWLAFA